MLAVSVAAIYWLQPLTPIRYLDFWLPTAALGLTVWTWAATRPGAGAPTAAQASGASASGGHPARAGRPPQRLPDDERRATLITGLVVAGLVLLIGLTRYLGPVCCLTPAPPPAAGSVVLGLGLMGGVAGLLFWRPVPARWLNVGVLVLIGLLVVTKLEPAGRLASAGLRTLAGQPADLALATDLRWLGFSYLSFRLMHVLRDRAAGRLPAVSLREFLTYALFFPAYTAGPIDRVERFVKEQRQPFRLEAETVLAGGTRIALGVLKKFVLADSLALVALNAANAAQANSTLWTWVLVYAYAWRLYWDFSGYTDVAIGLGLFFGIKLPENFDRPYTRQNLTLFWNSWHITLAQWFRAYVFNPLTRSLRARPVPVPVIIFITQAVTMVLIGLWHGVTAQFRDLGRLARAGAIYSQSLGRLYQAARGAAGVPAGPEAPGTPGGRGDHVSLRGAGLGVVCAADPRAGAERVRAAVGPGRPALSAPASAGAPQPAGSSPARFLVNVIIKALLLFALVDVLVALVDPLPALGRLSAYNVLLPGRLRLPYGDVPDSRLQPEPVPTGCHVRLARRGAAKGGQRVSGAADGEFVGVGLAAPAAGHAGGAAQPGAAGHRRRQAGAGLQPGLSHPVDHERPAAAVAGAALSAGPDRVDGDAGIIPGRQAALSADRAAQPGPDARPDRALSFDAGSKRSQFCATRVFGTAP